MALMLPPPKSRRDRFGDWLYSQGFRRPEAKQFDLKPVAEQLWEMYDPRHPANWAALLGPGMRNPYPKEVPSSVPGFRLERAKHGENYLNIEGKPEPYLKAPRGIVGRGNAQVGYNLKDEAGRLFGSLTMLTGKKSNYVDEVYIDPSLAKTKAFADFTKLMMAAGRPIHGSIVNPRLQRIADRLAKRSDKRVTQEISPEAQLAQMVQMLHINNYRATARREQPPAHPRTVGQAQGNARFMRSFNRPTSEVEVAQHIYQAVRPPHPNARPLPAPSHRYLARTPLFKEPFTPVFNPRRRSGV